MSAAWVVYVLAVSTLVTLAAAGLEAGLRALGCQARFGWIAAMVLSAALPFTLFLARTPVAPFPGATSAPVEAAPRPGTPGDVRTEGPSTVAASSRSPVLNAPLPWSSHVWGGLSALVLALGVAAGWRTVRAARRWPMVPVGAGQALRSDGVGPAVVGVVGGRVVLPAWAFRELTPVELELAFRHEAEHVHARDLLVLTAGGLLVVLAPWNVPLWWQLRRLGRAVEMDCDLRTVRRGADPGRYARLLLEVAGRSVGGGSLPGPALARSSSLGSRIRQLTTRPSPRRLVPALAVAVLAGVVACEVPVPSAPLEPVAAERSGLLADAGAIVSARVADPAALRRAVVALAREAGARDARGVVALAARADDTGRVLEVRVDAVSGPSVPATAVELTVRLVQDTRLLGTDPDGWPGWVPMWVAFHKHVVEAHTVRAALYAEKGFLENPDALRGHMEVFRRLSPSRFAISRSMAAADRPSAEPSTPLAVSLRAGTEELP